MGHACHLERSNSLMATHRKLACLRVHRTKIGHCQLKFGDLLDKEIQFVVRFLGWLGRRLP